MMTDEAHRIRLDRIDSIARALPESDDTRLAQVEAILGMRTDLLRGYPVCSDGTRLHLFQIDVPFIKDDLVDRAPVAIRLAALGDDLLLEDLIRQVVL